MRKKQPYSIKINADDILRGQGADPEIIRSRNMNLVRVADQALEEGEKLLEPMVWMKTVNIDSVGHEKIVLENGVTIGNSTLVKHLVAAEKITAIICTVGSKVDNLAIETMSENIVLGLAMDGVGSAGVESLANTICAKLDAQSNKNGNKTTMPLSPGMIGWPINDGQPLIFDLLSSENVDVELSEFFIMTPRKTISMIIGEGKHISSDSKICDFCQMNQSCKFKNHYQSIVD